MKLPLQVASLLLVSGLVPAQPPQLILSEINPSANGQWIEILNRSPVSQDISTWSLYLTTRTPEMPQTYWFGFRSGTVIASNQRLRVNWGAAIVTSPPANTINTGNTVFHFLFGLGFEPMSVQGGAMALFRSQQNNNMNTPSMIEDWVSWGSGNHRREDLAAQAGRWVLGRFVTAPLPNDSIARVEDAMGQLGSPEKEWFRDASPTPLQPNAAGLLYAAFGIPCVQPGHLLLGPPQLSGVSVPVIGSRDFALAVNNTTGTPSSFAFYVFSGQPAPPGQPPVLPPGPGPACPELVHLGQIIATILVPTALNETRFPISFSAVSSSLVGVRFVVQTVLLDVSVTTPPYQGTTNAVDYTIGG